MKVEELEQKILPLYAKNRIDYDCYTYQNICKMYLNMRETDKVIAMYNKCKEAGIAPKKQLLQHVLEAGIRTANTEVVYNAL